MRVRACGLQMADQVPQPAILRLTAAHRCRALSLDMMTTRQHRLRREVYVERSDSVATPRETLGAFVRSHREQKALSQEQLAEACNTNRSVVAHLEQALRVPRADVLERLCSHLDIPQLFWLPFTRSES